MLQNYQHVIDTFTIVTGGKGIFDVEVDGEMLFSKKEVGRHAEAGEVLALFKEFIGPDVAPYPREK